MISVYGPVNCLSYGLVTTNVVDALCKLGQIVQLYPINPHNIECEPQYQENIKKSLDNSKIFEKNGPCLKIWHQWEHSTFPANSLRAGFPIFELDQLTTLERHNLNSLDLLFVCSDWAYKVCKNNNIHTPIRVIPLGVDLDVFKDGNIRKNNKTIFLNCGKWEKRKGHDILSAAFNSAFSENDKVELWMMPSNPFLSPEETKEWENLYKNSKLSSKIKFLSRQSSQNQISYIYSNAHFGVFPSRAEGWGLPILECMATGTIPITTNYSGMTEFCSSDNSFLVQPTELEFATDGKWFGQNNTINTGNWMKWNKEQQNELIEHMRAAHKLNIEKSPKLDEMRNKCLETANKFTWKNTAKNILLKITT